MIDLQAYLDGLSAQWQKERAANQMTLGDLISRLKELPADVLVSGLGDLKSYRGYYSDLSFEPDETPKPVKVLRDECQAAMGQVFEGYKGGEFMMGATTPLWVADYGCCGVKLMDISDDGQIITQPDD